MSESIDSLTQLVESAFQTTSKTMHELDSLKQVLSQYIKPENELEILEHLSCSENTIIKDAANQLLTETQASDLNNPTHDPNLI